MFVGTVVTNDDDAENLVPLPSALVDVTPTTKYLPSSEAAGISPSTGVYAEASASSIDEQVAGFVSAAGDVAVHRYHW